MQIGDRPQISHSLLVVKQIIKLDFVIAQILWI